MKQKYKRPTSIVICHVCNIEFNKENREINRTLKKRRKHICSMKCVSAHAHTVQHGQTDSFKLFMTAIRKRCLSKEMELTITLDYIKELYSEQGGKCAITGIDIPVRYKKIDTSTLNQASIDRIDNNKGYVIGNIQFVALGVNYMRNRFSSEDAKSFINLIRNVS